MKRKQKKSSDSKKQKFIFIRYLSLLVIALILSFTDLIHKFLLTITIYPLYFLLNLSHSAILMQDLITVEGFIIQIIPACVAVSAYFLLICLNLLTAMPVKIRIKSILFSLFALLFVNIIRLYILSLLFINDSASFDIVHKFTWYFLSIILVVGTWFLTVYLFKIKEIPAYSDIKFLIKEIKR